MKILSIALYLLLLSSLSVLAQDSDRFSITGQIRHRTEFDARDFNADKDDIWYHLLRTRIGLGVSAAPDVGVFVQAQDSRVFGGENAARGRGTLDGSAPALDLHQAYFRVDDLFDTSFSAQIGRQEMAYGNQRLIGSVGWSNIGRSFDAGILSFENENIALDIFAARLVGSTGKPEGQNLYGAYGTHKLAASHAIEGFFLVDNNTEKLTAGPDAGTSMLNRFTTGAYVHGTPGAVDYEIELIYQGGTQAPRDSTALSDISAYLLSGSAGYTLESTPELRFGVLYSVLSGDEDPSDGESNTFNTLFATNHKFYGFMDFFPTTLPQQGLKDLAGSISLTPTDRLGLRVDAHHFMPAKGILENGDVYGQELDFTANYRYNGRFSLQSGLSVFFPGELMEAVHGDEAAIWFYLMSTVTF